MQLFSDLASPQLEGIHTHPINGDRIPLGVKATRAFFSYARKTLDEDFALAWKARKDLKSKIDASTNDSGLTDLRLSNVIEIKSFLSKESSSSY